MNSKDLRAPQHVERLVRMGALLKIEGRTKSHFYVARTAQVYRRAIDDAVAGPSRPAPLMDDPSHWPTAATEGFLRRHVHDEYQNTNGGDFAVRTPAVRRRIHRRAPWRAGRGAVKNRFCRRATSLELMTSRGNLQFSLSALQKGGGERTELRRAMVISSTCHCRRRSLWSMPRCCASWPEPCLYTARPRERRGAQCASAEGANLGDDRPALRDS